MAAYHQMTTIQPQKILRGKMLMIQKLKCVELVLFYKRANLATNGTSIESANSTP